MIHAVPAVRSCTTNQEVIAMKRFDYTRRAALAACIAVALAGCGSMGGSQSSTGGWVENVTLSGSNEVPPVQTPASGRAHVRVGGDGTVEVKVNVSGMTPTAAHIHSGAMGANGPVIVPLAKSGDDSFVSPPNFKMSDDQVKAYRAGNTYVNVHSAKNPGGEIRAQLKGH
jgi:hypothetical protein